MDKERRMQLQEAEEDIPTVYTVPDNISDKDIFGFKPDPQFSMSIDYPNFSFGFQHFIHQSKDKCEIVNQFEGKKKVYLVMNKYERYIDDSESDINNISKVYFDVNPKPNILSRAFYKLWELLFMFDLIDLKKSNFVSAHLAEGPGSFVQATMWYRDKYAKKGLSDGDKFHCITLHSDTKDEHVPEVEKEFIDYYGKEKRQRFILHETHSKKVADGSPKKHNGDITDSKTIDLFAAEFKKEKADFITADGGFEWKNENTQEQEAYKLVLGQIITAVKVQEKGGNFVLKIFESFTDITIKFIAVLKSFYKEVHIVKPLMSRKSNSEKYLVCKGFLGGKDSDRNIGILEGVLEIMNKNKNGNLVSVFPGFPIEKQFRAFMICVNTEIANRQFMRINEIVDFIHKQNYRGDEYHMRRELQVKGASFWTNRFFPEVKDFDKAKEVVEKDTGDVAKNGEKLVEVMSKKIQ